MKRIRCDPPDDGLPPRPASVAYTNALNIGADYTDEEREFLAAIDRYKRTRQRPYPTWREVLLVAKALGYRRPDVDEQGQIQAAGNRGNLPRNPESAAV